MNEPWQRQRDTDIVEPVMMCDLENIDSHLTLQLIWGNSTEPQPGNAYYPQCYTITYARQKWTNPNILSKGWAIPMTWRFISVNFSQKTKSNKKFDFCVKPKVNVTKRNKNIGTQSCLHVNQHVGTQNPIFWMFFCLDFRTPLRCDPSMVPKQNLKHR